VVNQPQSQTLERFLVRAAPLGPRSVLFKEGLHPGGRRYIPSARKSPGAKPGLFKKENLLP